MKRKGLKRVKGGVASTVGRVVCPSVRPLAHFSAPHERVTQEEGERKYEYADLIQKSDNF